MTITIDLARDVEDKVQAQAAARGVPVKEYVEALVRQAAEATPWVTRPQQPRHFGPKGQRLIVTVGPSGR